MSGRKSQQEALRRVNEGLYKKLNDLRAAKDAEINELRVARDNHARLKQEMKRKADTTIKAKDAEIAALKTDVLQANRSAISAQQIAVKKMDEATRLRAENQRLREGIQKEIACLKYFPLQRERLSALLAPSEEWEPLEAPAPEEIEVRCPKCGSHRLEEIGVGIHAGTLYKCWECRNEWEDGI